MVVVAEYIWLGGNNELRSKTKVLHNLSSKTINNNDNISDYLDMLPEWNYDGSSTGQASGDDSEVIIKPRFICPCPFIRSVGILVLCDTYKPSGEPLDNNNRVKAVEIFQKNIQEEPWYGIEQEFFIIDSNSKKVLGFQNENSPKKQGQYYCSVGADNAFGRKLLEEHLEHCIRARLQISGINAEVAPGQWEYQIGPCVGINSGDQLWISRYILMRIAEKYNYSINFHPKPLSGDWNGSGCHTNYSTKSTREGLENKTGLDIMYEHMEKLKVKHDEHMEVYGSDNHLRMTGKHETANFNIFSYGVADRGSSVRIGNDAYKNKCGYYEDRRPSSNMDPYLVTSKIFETTILE